MMPKRHLRTYWLLYYRLFLVFLVLIGTNAPALAQTTQTKALLWEISGNGLQKPSYLFGTIHAICPENLNISRAVKAKLEQTQRLSLEVDMDAPNFMVELQQAALLPGDSTLSGSFSEADYKLLSEYFNQTLKIDLKQLDRMKPFMLHSMLLSQLTDCKAVSYEQSLMEIAQQRIAIYDKSGEQHYDIISAFIKSIRGSDPNGAIYWLARMIEGGEDPKFIARRLLILASEDIGNANPTALVIANNCFQAVNVIGWPESRIILSQCVTYLASSPKSNAAYMAINHAQQEVRNSGNLPVPLPIRNAPTKLMKDAGYGKSYKYSHDFPDNFTEQEYLPEELSGTKFYDPSQNPRENELRKRLQFLWKNKYGY